MKKQRLYRVTGISLLALVAAVPRSVLATAYTAAADGNWSAPATWGGSGYPANSGDAATINVTRTIDVDVSVAIDALNVTGNFVQTLNASTPNTLTVNTFTSGNINNFTIGNGLSLNIAGTGLYVTRGGTVNGTLNVLDGATLTYNNGSQTQTGAGIVRVASGGTVAVNNNSVINTATIDNGGLVEIGVSGTSTFGGRSITGGGEWRVNSGTVLFNNANQRISLDTVNALFTASVGNVSFGSATQGMHTVGAFNMSGVNTVTFSGGTARTNAIGRASAFHNLSVTGGTALDLAPSGGGGKSHTVSGTLTWDGALAALDAGGAVLNVNGNLLRSGLSAAMIAAGVTVNVAGSGSSWSGNTSATLNGILSLQSGAALLYSPRELYGTGTLRVDEGATVTLDGSANNNRRIDVNIVNNGLVRSVNNNIRPFNGVVGGTGVFRAESGTFDLDASATVVTGWSGTGTLDSTVTWHAQGTSVIDFFGNNNSITVIGTNATVILENGGTLLQLNGSARNALTVNGKLHVRGTSNLAFNNAQNLTVASGGLLGGDGAVTVAGGGQVNVQSGGTLAAEINGASATELTVVGGNLTVAGFVEVGYAANPTANEYLIATAPAIICTATTSGEAGWKAQVRDGTELWIVRQLGGTLITIR